MINMAQNEFPNRNLLCEPTENCLPRHWTEITRLLIDAKADTNHRARLVLCAVWTGRFRREGVLPSKERSSKHDTSNEIG